MERSFRAAGNFFNYEVSFLSVAVRDAVSRKLLETVAGGLAHLKILVNKSATRVQCNLSLSVKLFSNMSGTSLIHCVKVSKKAFSS